MENCTKHSDDLIEKRMRGIAIRGELTDEWQKYGAGEEKDYEILIYKVSLTLEFSLAFAMEFILVLG